jgi:protein SCO1/2
VRIDPRLSRLAALAAGGTLLLGACGGDEGSAAELTGIVREPAPLVSENTIPSLTEPGEDVVFQADEEGLQLVYFGFTNCPDVCPTTLADATVALRKLPEGMADRVDTVMVTVDPARDLDVLPGYVQSFIPDAAAAGTMDAEVLAAVAEPFGVVYDVRELDDGTVEVDHSPFLYAVDDQGELVLAWQFGAESDDIATDIETLLERSEA